VSAPRVGLGPWSVLASARLTGRRLLRSRKPLLAGLASLLVLAPIGYFLLFPLEDQGPDRVLELAIDYGYLRFLVFLFPVLFCTGLVSEEVQERTWYYLGVRSAGRTALALGKLLVGLGVCVAFVATGVLALHLLAYATDPTAMVEEAATSLLWIEILAYLSIVYGAWCFLWSALFPTFARVASLLFLGIFELGLGWMPSVLRLASMNHFAHVYAELSPAGIDWSLPEIEAGHAGWVLRAAALLVPLLAVLAIHVRELRPEET
jgi:ABC-type transport system involved in multi-copper enzyme maturation permease subunit